MNSFGRTAEPMPEKHALAAASIGGWDVRDPGPNSSSEQIHSHLPSLSSSAAYGENVRRQAAFEIEHAIEKTLRGGCKDPFVALAMGAKL